MPTKPLKKESPTTCRRVLGAVVPMPTLVSAVAPFTPLICPSTILLLCVTIACAPIAVAFVNDFYDEKIEDKNKRDRNLIVAYLEVEGPTNLDALLPEMHKRLISTRPSQGDAWCR